MGLKSKWAIFILVCIILIFGLFWYTGFFHSSKFTGTIKSIDNDHAIVIIEEGKILKSGHQASVDLSVAKNTTFQIGDQVKVGYGFVGESHPLTIETKSVKLIE